MFSTKIFVVFLSLLVSQINTVHLKHQIVPLALIDDANTQLDELGQLVLGKILAAHDQLQDSRSEVTSHSVSMRLSAEITVETERQAFELQITNLKELALSSQADISSCLNGTDHLLNELPDTEVGEIKRCITNEGYKSDTIVTNGYYNVDIVINKVQTLNFALGKCADTDDDCINSVIDQIKEAEVSLVDEVDVAVRNAQDDLEVVKAKIVDCRDDGVADFVHQGSTILAGITSCVEDIISRVFRVRANRFFFKKHNRM